MLRTPTLTLFEEELRRAIKAHPEREPPLPATVELVLTGADPQRLIVETRTGRLEPRGQLGSALSIHVPSKEFEALVARGLKAWLWAYDRGVVRIEGAPAKVEAVQVYIERVLRRAVG